MASLSSSKAFFIPSDKGDVFALYFQPDSWLDKSRDQSGRKAILYIPAFAEEMNKSRRMVALQARSFCQQGYAVLLLDLYGTGDSQGEFADANWSIWLANIASALNWLRNRDIESICLWGLRVGALLAMDFLQQFPHKDINRLICWQPVLKGDLFGMQFLRLKIASAMMDKNAPKEKVADLKAQLEVGQSIEVAGYKLGPELMLPMMALQAGQLNLNGINECCVFEIVTNEGQSASLVTRQWIDTMQETNMKITLDLVAGDNFWATQEIAEVTELLEVTTNRMKIK